MSRFGPATPSISVHRRERARRQDRPGQTRAGGRPRHRREPSQDCRRIIAQSRPDLMHVHGSESFLGLALAGAACRRSSRCRASCTPICGTPRRGLGPADWLRLSATPQSLHGYGFPQRLSQYRRRARTELEIMALCDAVPGPDGLGPRRAQGGPARRALLRGAGDPRAASSTSRSGRTRAPRRLSSARPARRPSKGWRRFSRLLAIVRGDDWAGAVACASPGRCDERSDVAGGEAQAGRPAAAGGGRPAGRPRRRPPSRGSSGRPHRTSTPRTWTTAPTRSARRCWSGLPCVASFVGGIPSLIRDGETGLLFHDREPVMLAARHRATAR